MDILIVKMSALGDVIHTLPALATIRHRCPQARITWLVEAPAADLVRGHHAVDRVLVWRRGDWLELARRGRWGRLMGEFARFVKELRDTRFDLIVDFQGLAKSAAWVALARGSRKAGFGRGLPRNEAAWLALNERVPPGSPEIHAIDRGLKLVEALGFPRGPFAYDLPIGAEAEAEAESLLRAVKMDPSKPFVVINPKTRWPTKDWDPSRFAAVADLLHQRELPAIFTGAPGDGPAISEIEAAARTPVVRLDGRTSLKCLAALYRRGRVVVSTDTGPMHLAVAVGTPVVALFGPTAPWRTGPYGPGNTVLRLPLDCSPCFQRSCATTRYEKRACMLRLRPEDVVEAVRRHWQLREGGRTGGE